MTIRGLPNGFLAIHVVPSLARERSQYPLTAYIAGTSIKGYGHTVFSAIEDLFTEAQTARVCRKLEQAVQEMR